MSGPPYDPRGVANLMLDEADRVGISLTHLALQKLVYFAHGIFLNEGKEPLVSGYFEAWQYGPVHPVLYKAFQAAGKEPIHFRAQRQDILTGATVPVIAPETQDIRRLVQRVINSLGRLPAGRLVKISHARHSPWDVVVDKARTSVAFGLRIPDTVIVDRFKFHKMSVDAITETGDPSEDAPFGEDPSPS